jgi:hypothetical protein
MMDWLNSVNGKKTYSIVLFGLGTLLVAYFKNKVSDPQAITDALALLLAATVRHGIATSAQTTARAKEIDGIKVKLK